MGALGALVVATMAPQSAALPAPKRVAIVLRPPPPEEPDPTGQARRWYAGELAKHGLVDGKDIEVVIILVNQKKFDGDWNGAFSDAVRQAATLRPAAILMHADGWTVKNFALPVARGVPLVAWGVDDGTDDTLEALNRRGENVTGCMYSYFELVTMRFALMKELKPGARSAAMLIEAMPAPRTEKEKARIRRDVARIELNLKNIGLEFTLLELPRDSSADDVIAALRKARIDLVEFRLDGKDEFWESLARSGILASGVMLSAKKGALLSGWTVGWVKSGVRLAAKVLRGARAADIPVERAIEFRLAINLGTARTLGISVPPSVLLRADEVFE
jgi:putative ABC transport system substrate-binding protein